MASAVPSQIGGVVPIDCALINPKCASPHRNRVCHSSEIHLTAYSDTSMYGLKPVFFCFIGNLECSEGVYEENCFCIRRRTQGRERE